MLMISKMMVKKFMNINLYDWNNWKYDLNL